MAVDHALNVGQDESDSLFTITDTIPPFVVILSPKEDTTFVASEKFRVFIGPNPFNPQWETFRISLDLPTEDDKLYSR